MGDYSKAAIELREKAERCYYCGCKLGETGKRKRTLDHVKPISSGGTYALDNLVPCCARCNNIKGSKNPQQMIEEFYGRIKFSKDPGEISRLKSMIQWFKKPYGMKPKGATIMYNEDDRCLICNEFMAHDISGICQDCFDDGISNSFMDYLESIGTEGKSEFYFGQLKVSGYAYSLEDVVNMCECSYKTYISYGQPDHTLLEERKKFIMESDTMHFVDWLIERSKQTC